MIFVDTNVFMYAVGREHPLREEAQRFFEDAALSRAEPLATSAEVLQELLHAYIPVQRMQSLDNALRLIAGAIEDVWPIDPEDVTTARALADTHTAQTARDLLHLACCLRHDIDSVKTYDRSLASAFARTR